MRLSFLIGAVCVAVVVILAIQFWPERDPAADLEPILLPAEEEVVEEEAPEVVPVPVAPQPTPEPVIPAEPQIQLPPLAESDNFVVERIGAWSLPASWLRRGDLLARAAVVLQNAADGRVPRRQVAFLTPGKPYQVIKEGERYFVDPASYARYDTYIDVLERVPPSELAQFATLVTPLLTDALGLLGDRRQPGDLLAAVSERISALPDLPSKVELLRPKVVYTYADPNLEGLPEFDKQVLRMGPENISRLRSYLAEFKDLY